MDQIRAHTGHRAQRLSVAPPGSPASARDSTANEPETITTLFERTSIHPIHLSA
jgi:hypothetical protein